MQQRVSFAWRLLVPFAVLLMLIPCCVHGGRDDNTNEVEGDAVQDAAEHWANMNHDELADLLQVHAASDFWKMMADGLAQHLVRRLDKRDAAANNLGSDRSSSSGRATSALGELRSEGDAMYGSGTVMKARAALLQMNEQGRQTRQELLQSHALVRGAVLRALDLGTHVLQDTTTYWGYHMGQKVYWEASDAEIAEGEAGTVVGFTHTKIRVEFESGTFSFSPSQLRKNAPARYRYFQWQTYFKAEFDKIYTTKAVYDSKKDRYPCEVLENQVIKGYNLVYGGQKRWVSEEMQRPKCRRGRSGVSLCHAYCRERVLDDDYDYGSSRLGMSDLDAVKWDKQLTCGKRMFGDVEAEVDQVEVADHQSGESALVKAVKETWSNVYDAIKNMAWFFTHFLRWEVQINFFGGTDIGIPQIGWKCQPLFSCAKEILLLPKKFLELVATVIWGIGKILWGLVQDIVKFLGHITSTDVQPAHQGHPESDETSLNVPVHLTGGKKNEAPDKKAIDAFVNKHHAALFDEQAMNAGNCVQCSGRIKGLFAINPFDVLLTIETGGLIGAIKLWVTTVPVPLAHGIRGCIDCNAKLVREIRQALKGTVNEELTKRYFSPGKCHAHSVGFCIMLEKVRACNFEWDTQGTFVGKTGEEDCTGASCMQSVTHQTHFCDHFKGVQLRLTQAHGGVRCMGVWQEAVNGTNVQFEEDQVTTLDMKEGCHQVRKTLKHFNQACEVSAEAGVDIGAMQRFGSWLLDRAGHYNYKEVMEPQNMEMVAEKCRALFGCGTTKSKVEHETSKGRTSVKWSKLQAAMRSVIENVDDFQRRPRSYSPERAAQEIAKLLDRTSQQMEDFQTKVTKKEAALALHTVKDWGQNLEKIFLTEHWDTRCFAGLDPDLDKRLKKFGPQDGKAVAFWKKQATRILPETSPTRVLYGNLHDPKQEAMQPPTNTSAFTFFAKMAATMKTDEWGSDNLKKCITVSRQPDIFKFEPKRQLLTSQAVVDGPVIDVLVMNDVDAWTKGWMQGFLVFRVMGPGSQSYVRLVGGDSHHWALERCFGSVCGGAVKGAVLEKITVQGARGPAVRHFRDQAWNFLQRIHTMDNMLLRTGNENNLGMPAPKISFLQALALLKAWEKALFIVSECEKRMLYIRPVSVEEDQACAEESSRNRQNFFRKLRQSGGHDSLAHIVDSHPELQAFFKSHDYTFRREKPKVRHETFVKVARQTHVHNPDLAAKKFQAVFGGDVVTFRVRGSVLSTAAELNEVIRALSNPHGAATHGVRDGIRQVGFDMVGGSQRLKLFDQSMHQSGDNPFVALQANAIFQTHGIFQCGVELLNEYGMQDGKSFCHEGVTFGCNDNGALFVEDGCDANFTLRAGGSGECHVRCAAERGRRSVCSCDGKTTRTVVVAEHEVARELLHFDADFAGDAVRTYIVNFESVPLLEAANLTSRRVGRVYAGQLLEILEFATTVTMEDAIAHWTLGRIKSPPSWMPLRRVAERLDIFDESEGLPLGFKEAREKLSSQAETKQEEKELTSRLIKLMSPSPYDVTTYAVPLGRSMQAGSWPPEGISHVKLHFKPLETFMIPPYVVEAMTASKVSESKQRDATVDKGEESAFALKLDGEDPTQQMQFDELRGMFSPGTRE